MSLGKTVNAPQDAYSGLCNGVGAVAAGVFVVAYGALLGGGADLATDTGAGLVAIGLFYATAYGAAAYLAGGAR